MIALEPQIFMHVYKPAALATLYHRRCFTYQRIVQYQYTRETSIQHSKTSKALDEYYRVTSTRLAMLP